MKIERCDRCGKELPVNDSALISWVDVHFHKRGEEPNLKVSKFMASKGYCPGCAENLRSVLSDFNNPPRAA